MYNRFDKIPTCVRQTDGRTDILWQHSLRYAQHRMAKTAHVWSHFSGVSYGTFSLQTLCWETGDTSRSLNNRTYLLSYLLDCHLSGGWRLCSLKNNRPVAQRAMNVWQWRLSRRTTLLSSDERRTKIRSRNSYGVATEISHLSVCSTLSSQSCTDATSHQSYCIFKRLTLR